MKRELPILWKYLLVVALTCVLAFYLAQTDAVAQPLAPAYSSAGAYAVQVSDATWHDAARTRDVPVRIYSPKIDASGGAAGRANTPNPRFPIILFSHGLGGNRAGGKLWAAHWASHGYLVVAMQHAGSDEALWKDRAPREMEKSLKSAMTLNNLGLRVGDVHFVIDEVIRRTASGEKEFANADSTRIGMSGHSFGAQTTLSVAGQKAAFPLGPSGVESRIVSAVAFSPNARNKINLARQFGDIHIPLFSVTGTKDGSILGDGTRYQDRLLPYENMPAGGKYLVVFDGGDHMVFGGHELTRRAETARDRAIQPAVKAATLAFWNATLKQDDGAGRWLESGGFKAMLNAGDSFASK